MIVAVDKTNILQAAVIHSVSWQASHCAFCSPDFVKLHTPEHQQEYLNAKIKDGSKVYLLVADAPAGIVSITGNLIEDLYVLPKKQNNGYGTELLQFAIQKCMGTPTLWVLANNLDAARLYRRMGFKETGRINSITDKLNEIEFSMV